MAITISEILDVLGEFGIRPGDDDVSTIDFPEVGQISEGESVYPTSIADVLGEGGEALDGPGTFDDDDPRIGEWQEQLAGIMGDPGRGAARRVSRRFSGEDREAPEPHCAWYCPIHYFGFGWGIYIREDCILAQALDIAAHVDWPVRLPAAEISRQLLRSAFYVLFLHEQFHHKTESLGFRLLVATGSDRYRPYKSRVYRPTFMTADCIEESLANADSYRRLDEPRYKKRVHIAIRAGLRSYLRASMRLQPPGYREGLDHLTAATYRTGLNELQSRMLDGHVRPTTPTSRWGIAPNMITALTDITDDIYVVLPKGSRPIFRPTWVDPGVTVSTQDLVKALEKHYGYHMVGGAGKGSHVKLEKTGARTIILPGNRPVLSPGCVKHALEALGGHPLSRVRELLRGGLSAQS